MAERFVNDYLLYLLARASSEVSAQFHQRLKTHGLQVAEWRVLASLSDGDGMTIGELAARALQAPAHDDQNYHPDGGCRIGRTAPGRQ